MKIIYKEKEKEKENINEKRNIFKYIILYIS